MLKVGHNPFKLVVASGSQAKLVALARTNLKQMLVVKTILNHLELAMLVQKVSKQVSASRSQLNSVTAGCGSL